MTVHWVKIDAGFFLRDEVRTAGPDAAVLHLAALLHAGATLAGERIRRDDTPLLGHHTRLSPDAVTTAVENLLGAGLWIEDGPDHYRLVQAVKGWAYTVEEAEALSEKRRKAGQKGGRARWQSAKQVAKQTDSRGEDSVLSEDRESATPARSSRAVRADGRSAPPAADAQGGPNTITRHDVITHLTSRGLDEHQADVIHARGVDLLTRKGWDPTARRSWTGILATDLDRLERSAAKGHPTTKPKSTAKRTRHTPETVAAACPPDGWPSIREAATDLNASPSTVSPLLKRAVVAGLLELDDSGARGAHTYRRAAS